MHGTIAGHCSSLGLRGWMAALSVVWVLAQAPASAQEQVPAPTPPPPTPAPGASAAPAPPVPAPPTPAPTAVKPQETAAKATPEAGTGPAYESKVVTGRSFKLEDSKDILLDLLKLDAATLSKEDSERKKSFQKKAEVRAKQLLHYQPGAVLSAEDKAFLYELIYNFNLDAPPVMAAAAPTVVPKAAAAAPAAAPGAQASPSGQPEEAQVKQYAPGDPQYAPIFDNLEKQLKDFSGTLPGTDKAAMRKALSDKASSLITDFIPAPLSFLKEPAKGLLAKTMDSLLTKPADGKSVTPNPPQPVGGTEKPASVPGMPPRPSGATIPADVVDTMIQRLVNTKKNIFKKNADIALDQLKIRLRADADDHLELNDLKLPLPQTDDAYVNKIVDAVASPVSVIDPIADEVEKALEKLSIEAAKALGQGITTDRAADLLKRITTWLKDEKKITFAELPPADQEKVRTLVDKVLGKEVKPTAPGITPPGNVVQTNPANLLNLFPSQILSNTMGTPFLMLKPGGCHFFRQWTTLGNGYTVIIR